MTKFIATLPTPIVFIVLAASFFGAMFYHGGVFVAMLPFFFWIYSLAVESNRTGKSLIKFKMALIYAGVCLIVKDFYLRDDTSQYEVFLTLSYLASIIYSFSIVAKNMKSIELKRDAKFDEYKKIFFGLWFFPIGMWSIQPQIKNIALGLTVTPSAVAPKKITRWSKTEVCPHCAKEINLSSILYSKNPFSDIFAMNRPSKIEKMVDNYDQITCPYCHHKYKSNKAMFFGFITPKHMKLFMLLYPLAAILFAAFILIKETGFLR